MQKLILVVLFLTFVNGISSMCDQPFLNGDNGYTFSNCYHYAGVSESYNEAVKMCLNGFNSTLVTPKFSSGLDDLSKLYKAYPNYYFWVIFI